MTKKAEKILDVEIIEEPTEAEIQLAELNDYKNDLIAQNRELEKEEAINNASMIEIMGMYKAHKINEKFNKTLLTIKLREIRERKEYKNLTLLDINGEPVNINSWKDFCRAMGTTEDKVDKDIQNLNTFGQEFMQLSESIGLSYRELRRMRQNMLNPSLTEQEKLAIEEAKGKDPKELLSMLEDLQDKQASQEEKIKNLEAEQESKSELISEKSKQIDKLKLDLTKLSSGDQNTVKQIEKNRLLNTLEQEFAKNISYLQSAKVAFLEGLRLQENGELDEQENERFEEAVLQFLTNVMRFSSEVRTEKYNFLNAADNLGLLWLFEAYIKQNKTDFIPENQE